MRELVNGVGATSSHQWRGVGWWEWRFRKETENFKR